MKTFFTLLLGLLCLTGAAQTGVAVPELVHFDGSIQQFMRRWEVLGASVALTKDGKLVYDRAFGYADVARTVPLQPHHLMRVASISKTVTALAIMMLVEQGKISLSHPVFGPRGYLNSPAYTREIKDARLRSVTVQHLLEHTAGWDRGVGCDGYAGCDPIDFPTHVAQVMGVANPVGDTTLIRYMVRQGLNHAPGTHFAYSNTGYLLLGKVLEAVTRQPYETWVRQHLLRPSGVLEAHLARNLPTARLERETDYLSRHLMLSCYNTGQQVPAAYGGFQIEAMNAHGGWLFSARDLVRLATAADGSDSRPDLLSAATLRAMTRPSAACAWYAKGWMVEPDENWWHTGQLDGTASLLMRTASGYTWAILLNTDNDTPQFWRELKALGWNCVGRALTWPAHDLFAPARNASLVQASAPDSAHAALSWANGNGSHRLVLLRADGPSTAFPLDGTAYPAGSVLADGSVVVATGTARTARLPALDPQRTYYARVVEFRQDATTDHQPVYTVEGNPGLALNPGALARPRSAIAGRPGPGPPTAGLAGPTSHPPQDLAAAPAAQLPAPSPAPEHLLPARRVGRYFSRFQRAGRERLVRLAKR